ncbi:uncharacterized protein V1518DRAFT_421293 [Limtongia smithiae]|uniref:uncharacterized protein n=1 Tax=Limtongia smithiae TaxID=1125753 RepID=UPI0034CD65C2
MRESIHKLAAAAVASMTASPTTTARPPRPPTHVHRPYTASASAAAVAVANTADISDLPVPSDFNETRSATTSPTRSNKHLVLCFDGTGSQFGQRPASNVLRMHQMIERGDGRVIDYYQPGIGSSIISPHKVDALLTLDSLIAYTFDEHVIAAYRFLIRNYDAGDRIWMFGYSRGAYTACVVASLIERIGLLGKGGGELVPSAWQIYKDWATQHLAEEAAGGLSNYGAGGASTSEIADEFKDTFACATPRVFFLGLWDTVQAVGLLRNRMCFSATRPAGIVQHVRHALSVDERRTMFRQNLFHHPTDPAAPAPPKCSACCACCSALATADARDVVERWFPGNHSDIGGGWPPDPDTGGSLPDLSLRWMVRHARGLGLPFSEDQVAAFAAEGATRAIMARTHDMLSINPRLGRGAKMAAKWWLLEILPMPYTIDAMTRDTTTAATSSTATACAESRAEEEEERCKIAYEPHLGRRRKIPPYAVMHWSVKWKQMLDPRYRPRNLPVTVLYEDAEAVNMPDDLVIA